MGSLATEDIYEIRETLSCFTVTVCAKKVTYNFPLTPVLLLTSDKVSAEWEYVCVYWSVTQI